MAPSSKQTPSFTSRRGLLAALWSLINVLTLVAFIVALIFGMKGVEDANEYYKNNYQGNSGDRDEQQIEPELAVTSRAIVFSSMWTAVLAVLLSIFGTVMLGFQVPTGQYYTCCSSQVHRTTSITLGGFIGALIMFANLTLVCAALFAEFEVRDYREGDHDRRDGEGGEERKEQEFFAIRRKASLAFSILCLFLAVMYGSFAAFVFVSSEQVLDELAADDLEDPLENKAGLAPGLASPRLSSKTSSAHFVRPHEVAYRKHSHHATSSLGAFPSAPTVPAPQGTLT